MLPCQIREPQSSLFGFNGDVTICSYVPKKKKAVILLSTLHHDKSISGAKNNPEIITFYNKTKLVLTRWIRCFENIPLRDKRRDGHLRFFFFNILDISALAAYIIYKANVDMRSHKKNERRLFLCQLGENLCLLYIQDR